MKKPLVCILVLLCLTPGLFFAQTDFRTKPGLVVVGGNASFLGYFTFNSDGKGLLKLGLNPLFGQFITRDTMLFTHLVFNLTIGLSDSFLNGDIGIGAQGRYFFSTEEAFNFFLGVEVQFGMQITPSFSELREHLLTGPVVGFLIPMNDKICFDLSLSQLVYLPLNTYEPMAMLVFFSFGVISTL